MAKRDENNSALLTAAGLSKWGRLELIARQLVEGFISGLHKSPYKGFSAEFAEHRQYTVGDDVRRIDWRVYGRRDRYYVKEFEEETNLRCVIVLDASGSMKYRGDAAHNKFTYAQHLAAAMTYLMLHQRDAVGLVTFDTAIGEYVPARSRANHLRVLLEHLAQVEPGGETAMAPILHEIAERIHRRGLVVILSDFFDDAEALKFALSHLRHKRHEVLAVQVMAEEELRFHFKGWTLFRDLENAENRKQLEPSRVREEYLANLQRFLDQLRHDCGQMQIDYVQMSTRQPPDAALAGYLAARQARLKGR